MSDFDPIEMQKQQEAKEFAKELFREKRKEKKADLSFLPPELQHKEGKKEEVYTPVLGFSEMVTKVKKQEYDKQGLKKWKLTQSKEMKAITKGSEKLSDLLKKNIEPETYDKDYKTLRAQYDELMSACSKYLEEKKPRTAEGKARYELVHSLSERLSTEIRMIDFNAETFKKQGDMQGKTWNNVVTEMQRRVLKNDVDGVKIHQNVEGLASGTSQLTIIEDQGKKFYFKKAETVCDLNSDAVVASIINDYKETMRQIALKDKGEYPDLTDEQREEKLKSLANGIKVLKASEATFRGEKKHELYKQGSFTQDDMAWEHAAELLKNPTEKDKKDFLAAYAVFKKKMLMAAEAKVARIEPGSEISKRNEATSIMADLIGISDMMMVSKRAKLDMDGQKVEGLRMDEVEGKDYFSSLSTLDVIDKTVHVSPKACSQLLTLQVFDIICGQVDRNATNYLCKMSTTKDGKVIFDSICGIDNDLCFGKLTYNQTITKETNSGGSVATEAKGLQTNDEDREITLLGLDKNVAERILAITPAMIDTYLGGLLSKDEVDACKDRLKGVQQVLIELKKRDKEVRKDKKAVPILPETEKEWEAFRDSLEERGKSSKERDVISGTSYFKRTFLGQKMETFADYPKFHQYAKAEFAKYQGNVQPFIQYAKAHDLKQMKAEIPMLEGKLQDNGLWMRDILRLESGVENIINEINKGEPETEEEKKKYWANLDGLLAKWQDTFKR